MLNSVANFKPIIQNFIYLSLHQVQLKIISVYITFEWKPDLIKFIMFAVEPTINFPPSAIITPVILKTTFPRPNCGDLRFKASGNEQVRFCLLNCLCWAFAVILSKHPVARTPHRKSFNICVISRRNRRTKKSRVPYNWSSLWTAFGECSI